MRKVLKILEKNQILNQVSLNASQSILYAQRPNTQIQYQSENFFEIKCPPSVSSEKFKETESQLNELQIQFKISQSLGKGEKMPTYFDLHQVFGQQKTSLSHRKGEVLLVDVWATWCGPCQSPMQHNQQMLVKNQQKWGKNVRIVAVSVDQQKQVISQRVNSKGWNKIQHLTLLGWDNQNQIIQNFQIQGIPFIFLVDKSGTIDYVGHPLYIDLQKRIYELLQSQQKPNQEKKEQKSEISLEKILTQTANSQSIQKKLSKEALQQHFGKYDLFGITEQHQLFLTKGKLEIGKFNLKVSVYEDNLQAIDQLKDYFKQIDTSLYKLQQNIIKIVNPPEVQNIGCEDCKSKLKYPFYWCKWDPNPNSFRCRECVQKKPSQEGKYFSYSQNSVLLTGPFKKIAFKKLGQNIQPQKIQTVEEPHRFCCNGCGQCPEEVGQARYICLGCRSEPDYRRDYVDVCQKCMKKYLEGDQEVKDNLKKDKHRDNHPFLRVLFNTEGYYKF